MEPKKIETDQDMELTLDFTFHAPIELVFDTLTQPEHLKHWNCPPNMDVTFAESTLEVGGEYRIGMTMREGDGTEMMFIGKYLEINRPDLLSYTQSFSAGHDTPLTPETTITIKLNQEGSETKLRFNQTGFANKRSFQGARVSWPTIYDKLDAYIQSIAEA